VDVEDETDALHLVSVEVHRPCVVGQLGPHMGAARNTMNVAGVLGIRLSFFENIHCRSQTGCALILSKGLCLDNCRHD